MKDRAPYDAITSILALIPPSEVDLLDELAKAQSSALYASPELYVDRFERASAALEEFLGPPPLGGWKERVRRVWMREDETGVPGGGGEDR